MVVQRYKHIQLVIDEVYQGQLEKGWWIFCAP
jgi:hypothetical protein